MGEKEFNPHELTDVECQCGCHNRMSLGIVHKGWKYLRGHKPTETVIPPTLSGARKYVKSNMGPEQIIAYFDLQIEQLKTCGRILKNDAEELLAKAKVKMNKAKDVDEQITQLMAVRIQTKTALGGIFKELKE